MNLAEEHPAENPEEAAPAVGSPLPVESPLHGPAEEIRMLFEHAPDACYLSDLRGILIDGNRAAEEATGYRREELVGHSFLKLGLLSATQLPRAALLLAKNILGQPTGPDEFTLTRKDGTSAEVEIRTYPLKIRGRTCVLGIARDIAARKRAQNEAAALQRRLQQVQKMEAIGNLAGGIAHDLNNSLAVIMGYANMIKMVSKPEEKSHSYAETIEKASQQAADLIGQVLGFARRGKTREVPVDMHQVMHDAIVILARTLPKAIEIRHQLLATESVVLGDPRQLQQVILNLGVNARDAMPRGGVLTFTTANRDVSEDPDARSAGPEAASCLAIEVADTGNGIPEGIRDHIFDPFFSTKPVTERKGLGLAVVHGIVTNHGGTVKVDSEVGRGSTFRLLLPLHREDAPASETGPILRAGPARGKILIVDDEPRIRSILGEILEHAGYAVETAENGQQAVQRYRWGGKPFDLVILDLDMPAMGGQECLAVLRTMDPEVKVLVSTGHQLEAIADQLRETGIQGFLKKPYRAEDILKAIEAVLEADSAR